MERPPPMKWSVFATVLVVTLIMHPDLMLAQPSIIHFHDLTVADGLSNNRVNAIYQDKEGFIWFGTDEGLNRYDGRHFIIYRNEPGDMHSIASNIVTSVTGDHYGNIWVATTAGISCLHPFAGKFDNYYAQPPQTVQLTGFYKVACLPSGEVMALINFPKISYQRLYKVNVLSNSLQLLSLQPRNNNLKSKFPYSIYLLNNGWIIYNAGSGLHISKDGAKHFNLLNAGQPVPSGHHLNKFYILYADSNSVWLNNTDNNLKNYLLAYEYKSNAWRRFTIPPDVLLNQGNTYGDHDYWFSGYNSGLLRINVKTGKYVRYFHNDKDASSIADNSIYGSYVDRQGTFWLATEGGVDYWNEQEDKVYYLNNKMTGFEHFGDLSWGAMAEDDSGKLWIGTIDYSSHHNGLFSLNPVTMQYHPYNCPRNIMGGDMPVWNIFPVDNKRLLISSQSGLYEFNLRSHRFTKTFSMPLPREVTQFPTGFTIMKKDNTGHIWFGLWKKGLVEFSLGNHSVVYYSILARLPQQRLQNDNVNDAVEDNHHLLWVIYRNNKMLTCIDPVQKKIVKEYTLENGRLKFLNGFSCICKGASGKLWIGTMGEGLICFDPSNARVKVYRFSNGLLSDIIYSICLDKEGRLWLYTSKGIQYLEAATGTFYTVDLDLPPPPGSIEGAPMLISRDNKLYIGYGKNLVYFNPDKALHSFYLMQPKILSLQKMDKAIFLSPDTNSISVRHQDAYFRVSFASLDMLHGGILQYSYRLSGYNNYWINCGRDGRATFSHLPPGKYNLQMRALIPGIPWNGKYTALSITIIPLFYQTWWFSFVIIFIVAAVTTYLIWHLFTRKYRLQLADMKREQQITEVRNNIARDIHDDIGAGLTRIAIQCEIIKHAPAEKIESHSAVLDNISKQARDLIRSLSEIVWTINPANDHIDNMLSYFGGYIHQFLGNSKLTYTVNFPEKDDKRSLHPDIKRNLLLILKESLNNVIRHADAKKVTVTFAIDNNNTYKMIIEDDGRGLPKEETDFSTGNGLHNMRARAKNIHADIIFTEMATGGLRISVGGMLY